MNSPYPFPTFLRQFGLLTLLTALLLLLMHQEPVFGNHQWLSWISLLFFISVTFFMFQLGTHAAASNQKNTFTSLVMALLFGKMLLAVMIVVVYASLNKPESNLFILPFFVVYFIYTIFETYFLMKISRHKAPEK